MSELLKAVTPEAFAKEMGWGAKRVRRIAKKLGACHVLGNRMALMPEDIAILLEATKRCPSNFSNDTKKTEALSGTIGERLPVIDYEERLAQRTKKTPRKLQPRLKDNSTKVVPLRSKER